MPKMTKQQAKSVASTEVRDFTPLDPGVYEAQLREVTTGEGKKGPYWTWVYEIPEGEEHAGRRFWNTTSLSKEAQFKMKETFDAFGVSPDTDSDELCGQRVLLQVGTGTINQGPNAGKPTNTVIKVMALGDDDESEDDDEDFDGDGDGDDDGDEDEE